MTHMTETRLLIHGARGRMGSRIGALATNDGRFRVVGAHDLDDADRAQSHAPGAVDGIIDFSSDAGAARAAKLALQLRSAVLVGTTGLSPGTIEAINAAGRSVAVMIAANTSRGVAVLNHLIVEAARLLGSA